MQTRNKWISDGLTSPRWAAAAGGGGRGRRLQGRTEAAQGKRKGPEEAGHGDCLYRRNLNIQRPRFNYSHVIHPTSESSM
jgi:hypothetical protein